MIMINKRLFLILGCLILPIVLLSTTMVSADFKHQLATISRQQTTISGLVQTADTGEFISATVKLYSEDNPKQNCGPFGCTGTNPLIETVFFDCTASPTNCSDGFTFEVDPGYDYFLEAIPFDGSPYLNEFFDSIAGYDDALKINLAEGEVFDNANFTLGQGGTIKGIVTGSENQPLDNIRVALNHSGALADGDSSWSGYYPAYTNVNGEFVFNDVLDGAYELRINQGNDHGYLATEIKGDDAVQVSSNQTTTLSAVLQRQGAISGRVTSKKDGSPIPDVFVKASPNNEHSWNSQSTQTDSNGYYTITNGLIYDTYIVSAETPVFFNNPIDYAMMYFDQSATREEATVVTVERSETTSDIDFQLLEKAQISGTVSTVDSGAFEQVSLILYKDNGEFFSQVGEEYVSNLEPKFHFNADPGSYFIEVKAGGTDYLSTFYNGTDSLSAERIEVELEQVVENIDIELAIGGIISITELTDSTTGAVLEDFNFSIYSDSGVYGRLANRQVSGLHTGQYYLNFGKDGYQTKYYDDGTTLAEARPIYVTAGETTYVRDTLTPIVEQPLAKIAGTLRFIGQVPDPPPGVLLSLKPEFGPIFRQEIYTNDQFSFEFDASQYPDDRVTISHSRSCDMGSSRECIQTKFHAYGVSESNPFPTEIEIKNGDVLENLEITVELVGWSKISGKVKNSETGEYLSGTVDLFQERETYTPKESINLNCEVDLDSCQNGYSFNVEPGTYNIRVQVDGYPETYFGNPADLTTLIHIPFNGESTMADFNLEPASGVLNGRVTDNQNDLPIPGLPIYVYAPHAIGNSLVSSSRSYKATTNEQGEFELNNLPPERYFVSVDWTGYQGEYARDFVRSRFENEESTSEEDRFLINVANNKTTTVNKQLQLGGTLEVNLWAYSSRITGTVPLTWTNSDASLFTLEGKTVSAVKTFNREEGKVTFVGVEEGDYRLLTTPYLTQFYSQTDRFEEAEPISIKAGVTQTVDVLINTLPRSSAGVTFSDKQTMQPIEPPIIGEVYRPDLICNDEPQFASDMIDYSSPSGNYFFSFIKGYPFNFHVNHRPEANNDYLPKILTLEELSVLPSDAQGKLIIPLDRGSVIYGKVASDLGRPLEGITVKIYKQTIVNDVATYELVSESQSNKYGIYRSRGLFEGSYAVLFDSGNDAELNFASQFYGDNSFSTDIKSATPTLVSLNSDQELEINQDLKRGGAISGMILAKVDGNGSYYHDVELYRKTEVGLELVEIFNIHYLSAGDFEFYGLPDGEYYLLGKAMAELWNISGFRPTWYGDVERVEDATSIVIKDGEKIGPVGIRLEEGGTIEGDIWLDEFHSYKFFLDDQNQYVEGKYSNPTKEYTFIKVYDENGNLVKDHPVEYGSEPSWQKAYSLRGLWPGIYYIYFESYQMQVRGDCNDVLFHGQWNGGGASFADAVPIVISGTEMVNLDGHLSKDNEPPRKPNDPMAEYMLSGRVVDGSNNPIEGVTVTAAIGRGASNTAITDANGEYSLNLIEGNYTITFEKDGYDFSGSDLAVTIDGSDQTVEQVVAPEAVVVTPTPEPPSENDHTIYLPYVVH